MKTYINPEIEYQLIDSLDILTVSLSGSDDGEPMPDDWIPNDGSLLL